MSKTVSGMVVTDVSAFAKSIRRELLARETGTDHRPVSHLELLNILARSAGFRNFQHLKASDRKVDTGFRATRCEEEASDRKVDTGFRQSDARKKHLVVPPKALLMRGRHQSLNPSITARSSRSCAVSMRAACFCAGRKRPRINGWHCGGAGRRCHPDGI